jgi:alkylated DNA repair dioxygenase AlkB
LELFDKKTLVNILLVEGKAISYGKIFTDKEAQHYLDKLLMNIEWRHDEVTIFGKKIITKRKVAWYGKNNIEYTYSHLTRRAFPWTKELRELKLMADKFCKSNFNSCLLNLYNNGEEGMGWHSDDEKSIEKNSPIASFSFGAERKFLFKHIQTKQTLSLLLENGSFLEMKGPIQQYWQHSLPKAKKILTPRINLTFRMMLEKQ